MRIPGYAPALALVLLAVAACNPAEEPAPIPTPAPPEVGQTGEVGGVPPVAPVTGPAAATPPEVVEAAEEGEDTCGRIALEPLIGREADHPDVPAPSPLVRHIRPDSQVTMDFRPERLNLEINADGVIVRLRCG
jgi:hypothetical protein